MDEDSQGEGLVAKIALDATALTLLYGSDDRLRSLLRRGFLESRDENIKRFVGLLQTGQESRRKGALAVALGQMVLAAVLALLGVVAFIPNLIGLDTPKELLDYFSGFVSSSLGSGPLFYAALALEFVFAIMLMLGSFYTLRQASVNLKHAGLVIDA